MTKSLLFIPDISGFTKFVQSTEIAHSQHVIFGATGGWLIDANTEELKLAEIEGMPLFFYKEGEVPSQEKLLAQIETMFTAFYSHLKMLETNRICPCNACATAPDLELKIVTHTSELNFIEVRDRRKPFGPEVIEAHRLLKNSVDSDNYALITKDLAQEVELPIYYYSKVFRFKQGMDSYDNKEVEYIYSIIDQDKLNLSSIPKGKKVSFDQPPQLFKEQNFPLSAPNLMEYITNYNFRYHWVKGVDRFEYNENEVTRLGTEHVCVIKGKHYNFTTVTKSAEVGQLVYGEMTNNIPVADTIYQFYIISPLSSSSCRLRVEVYFEATSIFKKMAIALFAKKVFRKNLDESVGKLLQFVSSDRNNEED